MRKKLLVITAGTIAAGVGLEILKQVRTHSSNLEVMVRYIDTAYLPNRYPEIHPGEWLQMSLDPRYMQAIYSDLSKFPHLENMLYPNLLPATETSGSGSIRYNAAAAVEFQRDILRRWIGASMADLSRGDNEDTYISIALVVSAAGATGSGSLERLIDVIVDAAYNAAIRSMARSTLHCDIFILMPNMQEVSDLGLANTLALFAEMAASRLSFTDTTVRHHQGRNIIIGWGRSHTLSSVDQLKVAAATLIRTTTDPISSFPAEFQEREIDNHVLLHIDPISSLPMHLSTATVVSISLRNLVEQIIDRDVARLMESLVFPTTASGGQPNILLGKLAEALTGENEVDIYYHLLDFLSEVIDTASMNTQVDRTLRDESISVREKVIRLSGAWQQFKEEIKQGRQSIYDHGKIFVANAIAEMERTQRERICREGISLSELRNDLYSLQTLLNAVLHVAREDTRTTVNNSLINQQIQALEKVSLLNWMNRVTKLRQLGNTIKDNLQEHLRERARPISIVVLEELQWHCSQVAHDLDIVLQKLHRQREDTRAQVTDDGEFIFDTGHPLQLMALITDEEIKTYVEHVSIFSDFSQGKIENPVIEATLDFRKRLEARAEIDALFKGDIDLIAELARDYTEKRIYEKSNKYNIFEVLLQAGEKVLLQRLEEAINRAVPSISYNQNFVLDRIEAWHVIAHCSNELQRKKIIQTMSKIFPQSYWTLLKSDDPMEIAIVYYVDGLSMSSIDDLRGRCLDAFLKRRQQWYHQQISLNSSSPRPSIGSFNQPGTIPLYSGKDAERRVFETGVIHRIYEVKSAGVGDYSQVDIPELRDNEWEILQGRLHQTLVRQGFVDLSLFPNISPKDADLLFKRYMQEHSDADLEYQESMCSLRLSQQVAPIVQQVYSLLEPIVLDTQFGTQRKDHLELEARLEEFFREFSLSTGINIVHAHLSKDFPTFLVDTETMFENIQVPNPILALVSPHSEASYETIENLHYSLINKKLRAETQLVIVILFCKTSDLDMTKQLFRTFSAPYGRDIIVVNHDDLMEIVSAKEPTQVLRRLILEQVSLTAVHPYVTEGPTSPHFFFGREPQLREISDRAAVKSYVLIGGRRIGKTSILNRLFHIQMQERFKPFLISCQSLDQQEPTKAEFLTTSSLSWKIQATEGTSGQITSFRDIIRVLAGDRPLVFLIDEADRLIPADSSAGWPLFGEMRALAEEGLCQFVFAGEYKLSEAMNDPSSPFHNFAVKLPIGRLDKPAVIELVTQPLTQLGIKLINQAAIVGRIYEFTSGHPNIVQRLCQRLINLLDQSQRRQITLDDVENIITQREFQQDDFLNTFWERATALERIISLLMAQNSERPYTLRDIRQVLNDDLNLTPPAREVDNALRRLTELRNILAITPNGYTFAAEAFPQVVANTTTAEDILEVLTEDYLESGDIAPEDNQVEEIVQ